MQYEICSIRAFSDADYERMYQTASPDRQQKADRFRFPDDRARCLCADHLARQMLSRASGMPLEQITFEYGEKGKPSANLPLYFNLSHSADMVLCAVSERPIGVDVEQIKPFRAGLVDRFFTKTEADYILGDMPEIPECIGDPVVCSRFYRVWTAKEAYVKMTGTGISTDLKQVCYDPLSATVCGLPLFCPDAPQGYVISILESNP